MAEIIISCARSMAEKRLAAWAAALAAAVLAAPAVAAPASPILMELHYDGVLDLLHLTGEAKVLTLHVGETAGPAEFSTTAEMKSQGLLRAFKLIDIHASSFGPVAAGEPQPRAFAFTAVDKRRTRRASISWSAQDVVVTPPTHRMGDPPPTTAQKLASADPMTQLSRVAYAASGNDLCGRSWLFFDGDEIYQLTALAGSPAALSARERVLGVTEAVACNVRYSEIAGFVHKNGARRNQGLKSAVSVRFGRLGPQGPWLLMSMQADTILGCARVALSAVSVRAPGQAG